MLSPRGVSRKAGTAAMRLGRRVGLSLTVVSSARVRGGSGHRPAASGVDALICRRRLSGAAILFAVTRAWNRALKRPCDGNTVVGPKTMGLGMWVTRGQRASTRRGS
jgi:hypothetical protein